MFQVVKSELDSNTVHSLECRERERKRHRERYVKEERSTVQSCHSPRQRAADVTVRACDCQEAWIMIALHVGYKANIKAMHIAVQDFKGCGEKKGPWE